MPKDTPLFAKIKSRLKGSTTEFSSLNRNARKRYISDAEKCKNIYLQSPLSKSANVWLFPLPIKVPVIYSITAIRDEIEIVIKGTVSLREWLLNFWTFVTLSLLGCGYYLWINVSFDEPLVIVSVIKSMMLLMPFLMLYGILCCLSFWVVGIPRVHIGYRWVAKKIIEDNEAQLRKYKSIRVLGHSLGGGVAEGILSEIEKRNLFPKAKVRGLSFNKSFYNIGFHSDSRRVRMTEVWSKSDILTLLVKPLTFIRALGAKGITVGDTSARSELLRKILYLLAISALFASFDGVLTILGMIVVISISYHSYSKHGMEALLEEMHGTQASKKSIPLWKYIFWFSYVYVLFNVYGSMKYIW